MASLSPWATALEITGFTAKEIRDLTPILSDQVVVEVVGQPGSDKRSLYLLALAAANGIVKRWFALSTIKFWQPIPFGLIRIEYDAADNWVRCTIGYKFGTGGLGAGLSSTNRYNELAVFNGPQCAVRGAEFQFTDSGLPSLPGIPSSSSTKGVPRLPFQGRTILTSCPEVNEPLPTLDAGIPTPSAPETVPANPVTSPNPKPVGDNRSRGAVTRKGTISGELRTGGGASGVLTTDPAGTNDRCCVKSLELVPLVFAALTDPGGFSREQFVAPTTGPRGS